MSYSQIKLLAERYDIVLASGSPRRVELLAEIPIEFRQLVPNIPEVREENEPPYEFALRMAVDKATAVASTLTESQIAIGFDTIVVLGRQVLSKPIDRQEASKILNSLLGNQHVVCTAVAFARGSALLSSGYDLTKVFFNMATDAQIEEYIASGEPMDKAGAYGIQGMGAFLVDRVEGSLDNVIGLPRTKLNELAAIILTNS